MLLMAAKAKQLHSHSSLLRSYLLGAISDSAWTGWAVILTSKLVVLLKDVFQHLVLALLEWSLQ